jgi:hypothetical protein
MRVQGLDGRIYAWKQGKIPFADDPRKRSEYHRRARALLHELFPLEHVYEEVYLPGCDNGEQHYHFVSYFHETLLDFIESKKRDQKKRQWAELNRLTLIELPYNEDNDEWRERINTGS